VLPRLGSKPAREPSYVRLQASLFKVRLGYNRQSQPGLAAQAAQAATNSAGLRLGTKLKPFPVA
jgi:hypothetical protein